MLCGAIVAFARSIWWMTSIARASDRSGLHLPAPRVFVRTLDRIAAERGTTPGSHSTEFVPSQITKTGDHVRKWPHFRILWISAPHSGHSSQLPLDANDADAQFLSTAQEAR